MSFRYFAIFGAMRTGSNLLEQSLGQYEKLIPEGELFNPHFIGKPKRREYLDTPIAERNADPGGFLSKLLAAHPDDIPGFRIFDGHDARMLDHAARDPECAAIVLQRNPAESFISLSIAGETGQWMLMKEENRRLAKVHFDIDAFETYESELNAHYDLLRRKFLAAGRRAIWVRYEDLDDLDIINGIARSIGSPERKAVLPEKTFRQNPSIWEDKVENVEELKAYVAGRRGLGSPPEPDPEPRPRFAALDELIASRGFEAIYAPIPGAGASEFRKLLTDAAQASGIDGASTVKGLQARHVERRRWRGAFVFSFVRDPAERIYDVFCKRIARIDGGVFTSVQMLIAQDYRAPTPAEMASSNEAHRAGFSAFLNFAQDNLAGRTQMRIDPAWTPQSNLLAHYSKETPVDFIGRFERLESDIEYVFSRIGARSSIAGDAGIVASHFQKAEDRSPGGGQISNAQYEKIRHIFQRDYARLGYD